MAESVESLLAVDWDVPRKPYPPKYVILPTGERMVVREASREEVPLLLEAIKPLFNVRADYYDVVSARMYAELLGWYRYRVRNEYCLVGVVDGKLVGIVNNRLYDQKTCVSLHTIALKRGRRIGAHLFAAKHEHAMENYGVEEILITAESPRGFRRWMLEWGLEYRPGIQHELGGAACWVLTRENYYRQRSKLVFGKRPVPEDMLERSMKLEIVTPDILKEESD